jgi:hypothetical protein
MFSSKESENVQELIRVRGNEEGIVELGAGKNKREKSWN